MKNKMDPVKKAKIFYSAELFVIAAVFLTIGILQLTRVLRINNTVLTIFNWVTLFGGLFVIFDFCWLMSSKKRQAKNSKLDKALLLPSGLFLVVFDLICLIKQIDKDLHYDFYRFSIGSVLCYLAVAYIIEGFYHWKHPIPGFIEDITAEANGEEVSDNHEAANEEPKEDNLEEAPKEDAGEDIQDDAGATPGEQ